uniref:Uncharacterized protein n=1 Tax=Anguilla anguilla TaxID=7936 RepID=A0A0E9VBW8_ANGAN
MGRAKVLVNSRMFFAFLCVCRSHYCAYMLRRGMSF